LNICLLSKHSKHKNKLFARMVVSC
jgi:hypothetical protein